MPPVPANRVEPNFFLSRHKTLAIVLSFLAGFFSIHNFWSGMPSFGFIWIANVMIFLGTSFYPTGPWSEHEFRWTRLLFTWSWVPLIPAVFTAIWWWHSAHDRPTTCSVGIACTLGILPVLYLDLQRQKAHYRSKANSVTRRLLEAYYLRNPPRDANNIPYPWSDPEGFDMYMNKETTKWENVDLSLERKLNIISQRVSPEHALSPEVLAMDPEALENMAALDSLGQALRD